MSPPSRIPIASTRTVSRPSGTAVSGIPRRVTANPESKLRKPSILVDEKLKASKPGKSVLTWESIFTDKTATAPVKAKSYFSNTGAGVLAERTEGGKGEQGRDKENVLSRKPRLNARREYDGLRFNGGGSPTKGNSKEPWAREEREVLM